MSVVPPLRTSSLPTLDTPPTTAASTTRTRYRSADIIRFPLGDQTDLIYVKTDRSTRTLPSKTAQLLVACQTFKTIDQHAQECYRALAVETHHMESILAALSAHSRNPPLLRDHIAHITSQLTQLVAMRLLVSPADVLTQCRHSANPPADPEPIRSIGVVTRDRIASLRRCLLSYITNNRKYHRTNDLLVMDDSEHPATRNATRHMLHSLKARYNVDISYAGLEEKRRFADALIATRDFPPDVVKFALLDVEKCGYSLGANLNALLLHTVGDMIFSTDDDIICRVAPSPEFSDILAFDSGNDVMKYSFFPDRASALRSLNYCDADILAVHEQLLGRDLRHCVSSCAGADLEFGQTSCRLVRGLQSAGSKVLVTFPGLIGDSGAHSPAWTLFLEGDSRARLMESASTYQTARTSREVLRVVGRRIVTDNPWCMSGALGLDNRVMLPPFMPVQRNTDGIFGLLVWLCLQDGYFGHLPWTVLHAPPETRSVGSDDIWNDAAKSRLCDLVSACIQSFQSRTSTRNSEENLRDLGKHLINVGSMDPMDFEEHVRVQIWRQESASIARMEAYLQVCRQSPGFWAKDVRMYLESLRQALPHREYIVPRDLLNGRSADEALGLSKRLILKFGRLLYSWPDIVEASKGLRKKSCRLAVKLGSSPKSVIDP